MPKSDPGPVWEIENCVGCGKKLAPEEGSLLTFDDDDILAMCDPCFASFRAYTDASGTKIATRFQAS